MPLNSERKHIHYGRRSGPPTSAPAFSPTRPREQHGEALSTADKELYLKRAAQEIESLKFVGIKYDEDQKMAFPRKYIPPRGRGSAAGGERRAGT